MATARQARHELSTTILHYHSSMQLCQLAALSATSESYAACWQALAPTTAASIAQDLTTCQVTV